MIDKLKVVMDLLETRTRELEKHIETDESLVNQLVAKKAEGKVGTYQTL
jgi:hypothetical protein